MLELSRRFYRHPFFVLFGFLWLIRFFIGIFFFAMEQQSIIPPTFSGFLWNQLWSLGEIFTIMLLLILMMKVKILKPLVILLVGLLLNIFVIWSIADPFVFTLAGDHLTPNYTRDT